MTLQDLASLSGVAASTISGNEKIPVDDVDKFPETPTLMRLGAVLGIALNEWYLPFSMEEWVVAYPEHYAKTLGVGASRLDTGAKGGRVAHRTMHDRSHYRYISQASAYADTARAIMGPSPQPVPLFSFEGLEAGLIDVCTSSPRELVLDAHHGVESLCVVEGEAIFAFLRRPWDRKRIFRSKDLNTACQFPSEIESDRIAVEASMVGHLNAMVAEIEARGRPEEKACLPLDELRLKALQESGLLYKEKEEWLAKCDFVFAPKGTQISLQSMWPHGLIASSASRVGDQEGPRVRLFFVASGSYFGPGQAPPQGELDDNKP